MAGNGDTASALALRVRSWNDVPGLVHGFLGRAHSLAPGPFSGRDVARALCAAGLDPRTILLARQVHGARVLSPETPGLDPGSDDATLPATLPEGDALVSASADVILTVRTADCVPMLIVAERARAVAAVHAGWQGTLAGVLASALAALEDRYGARPVELRAALGPAIGGCCYEFGAEPFERFRAQFGRLAEPAWRPGPREGTPSATPRDRGFLDLRLLLRLLLEAAGVPAAHIETLGPCTAEHPAELHSYRRDGPNAGRQLSYIGWRS